MEEKKVDDIRQKTDKENSGSFRSGKKKRIAVCAVILCLAAILAFAVWRLFFDGPSVIHVPDGYTDHKEYLNLAGFQDSTDYCMYAYASAEGVEQDPDYKVMTEEDVRTVRDYFEDFKEWPAAEEALAETPLDESSVSAGDLVIIDTKEGQTSGDIVYGKYDSYSVWFFDLETLTLYYFHNNV